MFLLFSLLFSENFNTCEYDIKVWYIDEYLIYIQKVKVNKHMTRSFTFLVNVKSANLRPIDSKRIIHVISARPHTTTSDGI